MQSKNQSTFGKLQPLLFCLGLYLLALSFSICVCVSIFFAFKPEKTDTAKQQFAQVESTSHSK